MFSSRSSRSAGHAWHPAQHSPHPSRKSRWHRRSSGGKLKLFSYARLRPHLDRLMALPMAVVLLPVLVIAAILVKVTSRGSMFYTQTRLGLDGKPFTIYKLRTMYHDAENLSGATWCKKSDNRITPLGKILRDTHIDEFPQLLNVLRGNMALIGPRPERPEIAHDLALAIPRYNDRMLLAPGITGLAQIHQPPDTDLDCVRRKIVYDLYYLEHGTPWMDVRILLSTGFLLFGVPLSFSRKLLFIPNPLRTTL